MPDIKHVNDLNNSPSYCCYLLNVRSHKDYVCLEIDDCPSSLDITKSEDYSIDSSHVVMPILDKIRFNIKNSSIVSSDWFEERLQIYLVGKKIFPLPQKPCSKCNLLGSESSLSPDLSKNMIFIDASCNTEFDSNDDSNYKIDIVNELTDLCNSSDKISIVEQNCDNKSEMLIINSENSAASISNSLSLPNFLTDKQFVSKSCQTLVTLGNKDHSYDLLEFSNDIGNSYGKYDISKDISHSSQICKNRFNDNISIVELLKKSMNPLNTIKFDERMKCYPFQTYKNMKYWSFINSAKNSNEIDFKSILKSVDIQKLSSRNINFIHTLSPSSIILQLKKADKSVPQSLGNDQKGNSPSISSKWKSVKYDIPNEVNHSNDANSSEEEDNSNDDENMNKSKK